jgi:hypothetical protein
MEKRPRTKSFSEAHSLSINSLSDNVHGSPSLGGLDLKNRYSARELNWYDLVGVHEASRVPPTSGR